MAFKKHFWPEEAIGGFALSVSGLGGGYKKAAIRLNCNVYASGHPAWLIRVTHGRLVMSASFNLVVCFVIAYACLRTYRELAPRGIGYLADNRAKSYVAICLLVVGIFGGIGTLYNGAMAFGLIS
jgi:hypothetical protein